MKVVHVSVTPLAGSPIRIVNALNKYTDVQARSINLNANAYGALTFQEDLLWNEHRSVCESVIREADILHFHHWFDFGSVQNPFGFDFLSSMKPDAKYLMHWHSNPMTISSLVGQSVESIVGSQMPQMVVAQFHESYYPNAYPVPLIVEVESLSPSMLQRDKPIVFFSPSSKRHAYEERWETKGRDAVVPLLDRLRAEKILEYKLVENIPFVECNQLRSQCDIVIDDIITGSFHTTSLESMALGKPTFSYLDARTQMVLSKLTGTTDYPLINVRYMEAENVLRKLAGNRSLREEIGSFSREWMLRYYSEEKLIAYYRKGYINLLATGQLINDRYQTNRQAKLWLYTSVPDLIWEEWRHSEMNWLAKFCSLFKYKNIKKEIVHRFPFVKEVAKTIKYFFK